MAATMRSRVIRANRRDAIGDQGRNSRRGTGITDKAGLGSSPSPEAPSLQADTLWKVGVSSARKAKMCSDGRSRVGRLGWNLLFSFGVGADPKEENAMRTYVLGAAL